MLELAHDKSSMFIFLQLHISSLKLAMMKAFTPRKPAKLQIRAPPPTPPPPLNGFISFLSAQGHCCPCSQRLCSVLSCFSRVRLFTTPWAVAFQVLYPTDPAGKKTGVSRHSLLQLSEAILAQITPGSLLKNCNQSKVAGLCLEKDTKGLMFFLINQWQILSLLIDRSEISR